MLITGPLILGMLCPAFLVPFVPFAIGAFAWAPKALLRRHGLFLVPEFAIGAIAFWSAYSEYKFPPYENHLNEGSWQIVVLENLCWVGLALAAIVLVIVLLGSAWKRERCFAVCIIFLEILHGYAVAAGGSMTITGLWP